MVDLGLVAGKRQRRAFRTKPEAETYADQARVARQNEGTAAFSISGALRVDATKANQILSPHGVTLTEAASFYLKHVIDYRNAPTIQEIVDRMLAEAKTNQRRDRTISDLRSRLRAFAEDFPNRRLSELTVEDLTEWISDDQWSPLRKAAGILKWPPNGLRHSFGSYHLSFHGDAMKTATLMGHKDPSILHNHYKALVLKTEAEKFWAWRCWH